MLAFSDYYHGTDPGRKGNKLYARLIIAQQLQLILQFVKLVYAAEQIKSDIAVLVLI